MKRDGSKQLKMTFLTLEELMPEKYFLRDLERCVDFSFIYNIVEPLYARVGRPSVDPVLLVKMLLLGYLYGIPSERKLEQEVRVNIAFRWFLGSRAEESACKIACLWITILARAISLGNHFLTGAAEVFFVLIFHLFNAPTGRNSFQNEKSTGHHPLRR